MDTLTAIFGKGENLSTLQMCDRGIGMFLIALVLIRISGRRSFGLRTPLDNVITISLGAILSRAVVGASPFVPVVVTCFAIVLMHRVFSWLITRYPKIFSRLLEGRIFLLYDKGEFDKRNMVKAMVSEEDVKQGVRKAALTESMDDIEKVYMERNGEITAIRKL